MFFLEKLIAALSSRTTIHLLLYAWLGSALFSYFFLPPSTNDVGEYLGGALGILHQKSFGIFIGDDFLNTFQVWPGYSYFLAACLYIMSFLKISLSHFTYRLPHFLTLLLLLLLTCYLIKLLNKKKSDLYVIHINLFLIFLASSPFSLTCWAVRPEVPVLVSIVAGLIFYFLWTESRSENHLYFYLSSFSLGMSGVFHSNGLIISNIISCCIVILHLKNEKFYRLFLFYLIMLLPGAITFGWFFTDYPNSFEIFSTQAKDLSSSSSYSSGFQYLIYHAFYGRGDKSALINFFWRFFWTPLLVFLSLTCIFLLKYGYSLIKKEFRNIILITFLFSTLIISLILNTRRFITYYIYISFSLSLFFPILLISFLRFKKESRLKNGFLNISFLTFLIFFISFHSLAHAYKFLASPKGTYYSVSYIRDEVLKSLKPNDVLFLSGGSLLIPFIDIYHSQFRNPVSNKIYHILHDNVSEKRNMRARSFLVNKLLELKPGETIWGVLKSTIVSFDKSQKSFIIKVPGQLYTLQQIHLYFEIDELITENTNNIFFKPGKFKII